MRGFAFVPAVPTRPCRQYSTFTALVLGLLSALLFSGCSASFAPPASSTSSAAGGSLTGHAHGGQQPLTAASVYLLAAGNSGLQSASTSLLNTSSPGISTDGQGRGYATTDANGYFNITGQWNCVNAGDQIYILVLGGNPGLSGGTNNTAISMLAALGTCANVVSNYPFIDIDEVTTVAAAWALQPFATDPFHVGATSTNAAGLANAFATVNNISTAFYGAALTTTPNGNGAVPYKLINTLANILAPCVNSSGGSSTGCSTLFTAATPSGGTTPADTFTAALDMARNPSNNISALFGLTTPSAPFQPELTTAPNDWTLAIAYTGAGMSDPTGISTDSNSQIWIANDTANVVSAFSNLGVPLSSVGYSGGALHESFGIAVDSSNNIWVTDEEGVSGYPSRGSISVLSNTGTVTTNTNAGGVYFPEAAAADITGRVWIVNYGSSSVTFFNSSVSPINGSSAWGNSFLSFPVALAVDNNLYGWAANQSSSTVTRIAPDGSSFLNVTSGSGPSGIAADASGNLWVSNYYGDSITEISSNGTVIQNGLSGGGVYHPQAIAVDGAGNIWVVNYRGNNISELNSSGTFLSPSTGLGTAAGLVEPFGIVLDSSGNSWVTSFGNSKLVEFVGLAVPVKTPMLGPVVTP